MRILRGVGSDLLACGCFVGLYETYKGPIVQIIEERGVACHEAQHRAGVRLPSDSRRQPPQPAMPPNVRSAA